MPPSESNSDSQRGLAPARAPVAPRACRKGGTARLPIDRLILPLLQPPSRGLIVLTAPPGGGKSTALRHLRAVLPAELPFQVFDADQPDAARAAAAAGLAILAAENVPTGRKPLEVFELAPWTIDDCLEYLAAVHRDQCASVLKRLSEDGQLRLLDGSPQLLVLVMDQMALDPELTCAADCLRRHARQLIPSHSVRDQLMKVWTDRLGRLPGAEPAAMPQLEINEHLWWRHTAVQKILAADCCAENLRHGRLPTASERPACALLIPEIAAAVRGHPSAVDCLEQLARESPQNECVPLAATILYALNPAWRPASGRGMNLAQAELFGAQWSGLDLENASLIGTDLSGANLTGAQLGSAKLSDANLTGADLSNANLTSAALDLADLSLANLTGAILNKAHLDGTNLQRACLHRANFQKAIMSHANLEDADFTGANLGQARLEHLRMNHAVWTGVSFRRAMLYACNLEGLELPLADFTRAELVCSLLTGTRIPGGIFTGANLRQTGLSDIFWENADLREADFTEASFHLGSSRSGLVGSTIPCEGSKTGFYTDEYQEQDFKAPEEIRKACLRGADLRGAIVEKTDFYLVDLRGAKYTRAQGEWFAHCGAILHSRVA